MSRKTLKLSIIRRSHFVFLLQRKDGLPCLNFVPPLTDSTTSWYVGIALKDTTGNESKYVTLELSRSFDYSYAGPICALFFVSLLGGLFVSVIALELFKESFEINTPNATVIANKGAEPHDPNPTGDQDRNNHDAQTATVIGKGAEPHDPNPTGDHGRNNHDAQNTTVKANKGAEPHDSNPTGDQDRNNQDAKKCLKCRKVGRIILAMPGVAWNYWFSDGPKTYSYATGIAGFLLMIGAGQLVIANWYIMIQEGDRDNCYYNDFCYRVSSHDIPFNLMISNLTYIIHSLILTVCVWYMETELFLYCKNLENLLAQGQSENRNKNESQRESGGKNKPERAEPEPTETEPTEPERAEPEPTETEPTEPERAEPEPTESQRAEPEPSEPKPRETDHESTVEERKELRAQAQKKRYSFSIGYAFAWALLFEGLFSTLYHLCPSRFTFQFDSAFMFVIAGLTVLLLYNGIEVNECPSSDKVKYPVGALNFFLYFIVPLFIFNYFGSLYNSESGLSSVLQGFLFAFLLIWWILVVVWAGCKLYIRKGVFPEFKILTRLIKVCRRYCRCCRTAEENPGGSYCNVLYFIIGGLVAPLALFLSFLNDLSQVFLFTCILVSVVAVCAKTKTLQKICLICTCERPKCSVTLVKDIAQTCYIVFTTCVLIAAVCIFQILPTTDKTSSPEESCDLNEECGIGGFFDWHDLWHFLSSFALLMGAFVIMFISAEPVQSNVNLRRECADIVELNEVEINANKNPGGDDKKGGNEMGGGDGSNHPDGGNGRGGEK